MELILARIGTFNAMFSTKRYKSYLQKTAIASEWILQIRTPSLMVIDCYFLIDSILHQRVHNRPVNLTEEQASLCQIFREDYKAIVVENIAVQLLACAGFLAYASSCALRAK